MEEIRDPKITEFLSIPEQSGDGSGYGDGSGSGYGYGDGDGSGSGDGSGYGYGYGYGYGSGYGYGYGIDYVNGVKLHQIDGVPTRIDKVKSNVAKGAILNRDFSWTPCFIVKSGRHFAHGDTVREAMEAVTAKVLQNASEDERIQAFLDAHPCNSAYPNQDFFQWHHNLTGSCEAGRRAFAKDHDVDLDGSMTVLEFIALTEHSYGGAIIAKLRQHYE